MQTDADVIRSLQHKLSEADLSQTLQHILRIREIWAFLHHSRTLARIDELPGSRVLTPGEIAFRVVLDAHWGIDLTDLNPKRIALTDWPSLAKADSDLEALITSAVGVAAELGHILSVESDPAELLSGFHDDPTVWRLPTAIAWPLIPNPGRFFSQILLAPPSKHAQVVVDVLLSNLTSESAIAEISQCPPEQILNVIACADSLRDQEFWSQIAAVVVSGFEPDGNSKTPLPLQDPSGLNKLAIALRIAGKGEEAAEVLSAAWKAAAENTACIADELTKVSEDPVLASEAAQQAFSASPSSIRKARLAINLAASGRMEEAKGLLLDGTTTPTELAAFGLIHLSSGELEQAQSNLKQAAVKYLDDQRNTSEVDMLESTIQGLREIGEPELAFQILQHVLDDRPADTVLRITATHLLHAIGDFRQASEHARLAAALEPNSIKNKALAAEMTQAAGDYTDALDYWRELVQQNAEYQRQYAQAAYLSGNHDLAIEIAESMMAKDPGSVDAIVLLGQALAHSGDYAKAQKYLEQAVELRGNDEETWISLSRCQQASGDLDQAIETVSKGISQNPERAPLFAARSKLYAANKEYQRALEDAAQASEIEPMVAEWAFDHATTLRKLERDEEAIPRFETALKLQPGHATARSELALCLEKMGDLQGAVSHAAQLPVTASPETKFEMGRILTLAALQGETEENPFAGRLLLEAAEEGIDSPSLPYWIGRAYQLEGHEDAAFSALQECLDIRSSLPDDLQLSLSEGYAQAALATGKSVEALAELESAQRFHPTSSSLHVLLSEAKMAMGHPDEALKAAQQAIEFEPDSMNALEALSRASIASGSVDDAIHAYERMVEIDPIRPQPWLELSKLWVQVGDEVRASNALAHGLMVGRTDPKILESAADISSALSHPQLTERLLKRSISMDPDHSDAMWKLASFYEVQDQQEQANRIWLQLLERDPQSVDTLDRAAQSMAQLGKTEASIGLWQRALTLEPNNAQLQIALARSYLEAEQIQKGLDHLQLAFELEPENTSISLELGQAILKYGNPEDALGILQAVLEVQPDDPEATIVYAESLLKSGKPKEAIAALENRPSTIPSGAILALAYFEVGDLTLAKQAFQQAFQLVPSSMNDLIWLSRAAMTIGEWEAALKIFQDIEPVEMEVEVRQRYLKTLLRQKDLEWLLGTAFDVVHHAPPSDLLTSELERAEVVMAADATSPNPTILAIDQVGLWRSIILGDVSAEEVQPEQLTIGDLSCELTQSTAMALLRGNRPVKAESLLQSNPNTHQNDGWEAILLGLSRMMLNQHEEARTAFQIASRNPFLKPICAHLNGQLWKKVDHYDLAIESYNEALIHWPDEPAWNFALAESYIALSMDEAALPHLQKAVDSNPQKFEYQVAYARALKTNGQISDSEEYFRQALRAAPKTAVVWKEAAEVALANGNSAQSEEWFERAATLAPSDPHCLVGAAKAAFALGKKREAADRAQAAMRLAPHDPKVLAGMAEILEHEGKVDEALKLYERALNEEGASGEVRITRSKLLVATGRSTEAIEELKFALNDNPENHQAWAALGMAHEKLDAYGEAAEAYRQARDLAPRNPEYLLAIGRIARKAGQLDQALDELTRAETQFPADANLAYELGLVHEERRELQKALDAYRRSLSIHPEQTEVHRRAGLLLKELKAYREAEAMLERAAELDPRDPNVLHQLAAVRALLLVHGGIPEGAVTP